MADTEVWGEGNIQASQHVGRHSNKEARPLGSGTSATRLILRAQRSSVQHDKASVLQKGGGLVNGARSRGLLSYGTGHEMRYRGSWW